MKGTRIGKIAEILLKKDLGGLTLSDIKTFYKDTVHTIGYYWCPMGWKTECRDISINTQKLKIFFFILVKVADSVGQSRGENEAGPLYHPHEEKSVLCKILF